MLRCPLARGRRPTLSGTTSGGLELATTGAMVIARIRPIPGAPPRWIVKALGALSRKVSEHPGTLLTLIVPPAEEHPPALLRRVAQLVDAVTQGGGFMVIVGSRSTFEGQTAPKLIVPIVDTLEEAEALLMP